MSDISCSRTVLVSDYLSDAVLNKTYVYPGAAGRISNKYRRSGNNYFHIPPEEQSEFYEQCMISYFFGRTELLLLFKLCLEDEDNLLRIKKGF